ncbi:hypothetical protein CAQU_08340 [Corynebacterium aquilae DSM 44791]|uniref:Uncharacterized protein n=1 Tax=Corynebacterium aquilae DSM 44791 TaxID=1431546 RepID=A0A1L7CGV9_9CORY|nr:hypothetical protein CAQU_08340 [Corynebacterium aquilae DSM 44791]
MIYRRRRIGALILIIALILTLGAFLMNSDKTSKPMAPNGDVIGRDYQETMADYTARTHRALADIPDDRTVFALITFSQPLTPAQAGGILEPIGFQRVDAMVFDGAKELALPEPTAGATRSDVFEQWLQRARRAGLDVKGIDGVVVYATAGQLKKLEGQSGIIAIDPAPEGAVWGRFGIQPVKRLEEQPQR